MKRLYFKVKRNEGFSKTPDPKDIKRKRKKQLKYPELNGKQISSSTSLRRTDLGGGNWKSLLMSFDRRKMDPAEIFRRDVDLFQCTFDAAKRLGEFEQIRGQG